jgi:HAD superfamily hydrolase (TIGR01509 family)
VRNRFATNDGRTERNVTYFDGCAVLWDLDGTILDSRDAHWLAWRTFTAGLGKPVSPEFFNDTFGFRNEIILRLHLGDDLSDAETGRMAGEKESLYRKVLQQGTIEALPGVRDWLEGFRVAGWRQALASMAPRENIAVTLAALSIGPYFHSIVSSEDVRHGKPDPEVFLRAAEKVGVSPARCVVIEDSPQGVQAAGRAGMRCIAVGPQAAQLGADIALASLADATILAATKLIE